MNLNKLLVKFWNMGLILSLFGSQSWAFTLNYDTGNDKSINAWKSGSLSYDYNFSTCPAAVSEATLKEATQIALSVWNGVPSSVLNLTLGASVTTTASAALNQGVAGNPVVICDSNFSANTGADGNAVPAVAQVVQIDADYHITFAVLLLNAEAGKLANIANVNSTLLSVVMAHEIGHSLGLGHSSDKNALMYYDATAKTKLNLARDDIDGITYLYPRNELNGSKIFGCSSLSSMSSGGSSKNHLNQGSGSLDVGESDHAIMLEYFVLILACWMASRFRRPLGS